jgi:photosystem II stability/assembly factor-like uncharacterized protein
MNDKSHRDKQVLSTRYADLLDAQADADQLQLIDDLETLYTSAGLPAQLNPSQTFPDTLYTQQPVAPGTPPAGSPKQRVMTLRRKRWVNRLNALAAVLIAAMLVGSLLVVTHLAQHSQQANKGGHAVETQCITKQVHNSNAWLSSLHMINAMTGWALGMDHATGLNRILRTTNGGTTWQDVSPPQRITAPQKTAYAGDPYFLNACSAWVALSQTGNAPALLFRTGDGGETWQQSTLPGNEIRGIDFINEHTGWLMVDMLKNGVFTKEDIYHSVDGGQTWKKIVNNNFPFANADNNLTFINANVGWITGALSVNNNPRLYITHDGGSTWRQQLLPSPPDGGSFFSGTVVWRPRFFSATDGILPVGFWFDDGLDIYTTHDGGTTWQSTGFLHLPPDPNLDVAAPAPDPTFVDVNHGWASGWQGTPSYATTDGGKHWTKIIPQPNMHYTALFNYDFVTGKVGWALGAITRSTLAPEPPMLFKTEDGGKMWTYIQRG